VCPTGTYKKDEAIKHFYFKVSKLKLIFSKFKNSKKIKIKKLKKLK
jgi:hypothetical protein